MRSAFEDYFKEIQSKYSTGDSTEFTHRTPFQNLVVFFDSKMEIIHEKKREHGLGAPDFTVIRKGAKIGYIETKDLGSNLDEIIKSNQISKYIESIDNLILTDYRRFILLRDKQVALDLSLYSMPDLKHPKFPITDERITDFEELMKTFLSYKQERIRSPKKLASQLSRRARLLNIYSDEQLREDLSEDTGSITKSSVYSFYQGMKELVHDISIDDCVDAYAQTITYGLFLARYFSPFSEIQRDTAWLKIPKSIAVIRKMFRNISGDALPKHLSWIVDDLIDILNVSDMNTILKQIESTRGRDDRDPFSFFYEDFLTEYDSESRKHRGVYYTPKPVVEFIVRSIHLLLQEYFDKPLGLAEDDVTLLDPAVGTGTFLAEAIHISLVELMQMNLRGLIEPKIQQHLLADFYGFELLITPYIVSHLKLTIMLSGRWQYQFKSNERVQIYLTNTLEPIEIHGLLPFLGELTEESVVANEVKGEEKRIMVVLGNPPYSGFSANKGKWIDDLLKGGYTHADGTKDDGYYSVDGSSLKERNPKWLQDDYVKFIRYAQWKIDTSGEGIVGFITNNSYLDGPTFRGMRESLLRSFNRIYVLNLHGSSLRDEKTPGGEIDENVFDIKPGVAIILLVKNDKFEKREVFYSDLFGTREQKYINLKKMKAVTKIDWLSIEPKSPFYLFVPADLTLEKEWYGYWKITDIFPIHSLGIVTARDALTIKDTSNQVWETVSVFAKMNPEDARRKFSLGKDANDWKVRLAQEDIQDSQFEKSNVNPIWYRPFDLRYTYYTGKSRGFHCRPRNEVMQHMKYENLGLVACRQIISHSWQHALVSDGLTDNCYVSNKTRERGYVFPLYVYERGSLSSDNNILSKKPNIKPELFQHLSNLYSCVPTPEEIMYFIYAILYSGSYRTKYFEFLKLDFPRIPFPKEYKIFQELSKIGEQLVNLHIMKIHRPISIEFNIEGSSTVESVKYKDSRIYINKTQYFDGINQEVWDFQIGSYQVLKKWLSDRKNRTLSGKEIDHFMQMIQAITQTTSLMKEIDGLSSFYY